MKSITTDIIVVGGGIVGTFHAYHAAKMGYKVLLVERNPAPNGATVRNFGMVSTATIAAPGIWEGYANVTNQLYRNLQEEFETDLTLEQKGTLYLVETELEDRILKEFTELRQKSGYNATYLPKDEVLKNFDFAQPEYVKGGLLLPDDMAVNPRKFIHLLHKELTKRKIFQYQPNTYITTVKKEVNCYQLKDTFGNQYLAEKVFICNGIDYQTLFPALFKQNELITTKLHMLETYPQEKTHIPHNILSGLSLRRYPGFQICPSIKAFYNSPCDQKYLDLGIHLLFKQTAEGSVIIGDSHHYYPFDGSHSINFDVEDETNEAILEYGQRMVKLDTWNMKRLWLGYYSSYKHGEVFTHSVDENLHIATGIGGKGMSTGPGFSKANIEKLLKN